MIKNKKIVGLALNNNEKLKPVKTQVLNNKKLTLNAVEQQALHLNQVKLIKKANLLKTSLHKHNVEILPAMAENYTLRYFPPAIKVFLNSVYSFNKSFVKNLPQADNLVYRIIKGYFTLNLISENKEGEKSRLLVRRYKKLSLNRIIVSKPEIKHSADNVMITVYVYNKKKHSIIYRLKKLYKSLIWGKVGFINKIKLASKKNSFKFLPILKSKKTDNKKILGFTSINEALKKKNISILQKNLKSKAKPSNKKLKASAKNKGKENFNQLNARTKVLNKNLSLKNFKTNLIIKKIQNNLMINTSNRYNLKMNYLLDQDREYTASFRSFNYAKKKIYIVIARKFNFYVKDDNLKHNNTLKIRNILLRKINLKARFKKPNNLLNINNIRIVYFNKTKNLREKPVISPIIRLIKIKPRIKRLKVIFNILKYRSLRYINIKKRRVLFNRYKAKIIRIRSKDPFFRKKYHYVMKYKNINLLKFKNLVFQGLALQSNKKNKVLLYNKKKIQSLPVKINFKPNLVINPRKIIKKSILKPLRVIKPFKITSKRNLRLILNKSKNINFLPKIKKLNSIGYLNKSSYAIYRNIILKFSRVPLNTRIKLILALKHRNQYKSSLKFKYNPYKGLNTNSLNSISLLNKLNNIDLSFYHNISKFSLALNYILHSNNFSYPYMKQYMNTNLEYSNYVELKNILKVKLIGELLQREMLYTYYIKSLYINNLVFKTGFINSLCNIISKVYNKKVILNIVSLKYLFFNSDIFTQAITTRLKNHRKNRVNKVLNKVLGLVYLAKINEYAYNIHNPIYKYIDNFNNKYKHLRSHLAFTNNTTNKNYKKNNFKHNILKKLPGMPLYNLNHILFNQINFIKCKSVFGIKLQAKGRLTKRSTASRKLFKVKYLGNLRYNTILNSNISSYIIKNNNISNIQFSKIAGKTRIGSFGIKGWINNN